MFKILPDDRQKKKVCAVPGNKRITKSLVSLPGKTKPSRAAYSPLLLVRLYIALSGFTLPGRLIK